MKSDTGRLGRRLAAPIASLIFVAVLVAGCGSAAATQSMTTTTAALATSAADKAGNVTAALPVATSAPATTLAAPAAAALSLQDQMVAVIKQVTPAVVEIQTASGLGSGIVYDASGDIVTNYHVVGTDTTFSVTLSNGKTYTGTLVGSYKPDDIAVIKISAAGLSPATFGDSSKLAVGDFVLAMGNPLGLQSSVTEGIVSALGRQVTEPTGNALPDTIQTSAAINPGNSGGALVDLNGQVVGIPTLEATDSQSGGSAAGIGFAISSNRAKLIADQLIASGKVIASGRAYLGIQVSDGTTGPLITAIATGSPAAGTGLQVGDVVLSIDSTLTPDAQTLVDTVASYKPGDVVQVKVTHQSGGTATYSVTLGQLSN
jgi:S1-C subfamily serine protease